MSDIVAPTNINLVYGDDEYLTGVVYDATNTPKDLTAAGIAMTCTITADVPGTTLLTKTIGSGITVDSLGNYSVKIAHSDKGSIAATMGDVQRVAFAIRLTDTTGDLSTLVAGWLYFFGTSNG